MDCTLKRLHKLSSGIFSILEIGDQKFYTCEHAYQTTQETYEPKIIPGIHKCVRGMHRLEGQTEQFDTFEIIETGHVNLLFHIGNWQSDSHGCILVGTDLDLVIVPPMIKGSKIAFEKFISLQSGVNEFTLTVI